MGLFPALLLAALPWWPLSQVAAQALNRPLTSPESPAQSAREPVSGIRPERDGNRSELKRRIALVRVEDRSAFPDHGLGAGEDPPGVAAALVVEGMAAGGECVVLKSGQLGDMDRVAGAPGREPEVIGVSAFLYGSVEKLSILYDAPDVGASLSMPRLAHAKVSMRMVDPLTGATFFSESGEAEAVPEPPRFFRSGPSSDPDSTLPKRALRAAVDKLVASMTISLRAQPWRAGILDVAEGKVVISAGARAGLRPGRELRVVRPGKRLREPTSGVVIELPAEQVGRVKVISQFGTGDLDEGSVCALLEGTGITKSDRVERLDGP